MDKVTSWAAALCVAAIGCTALQMLAPKGSLGRLFKMITAAFFICCMAVPLMSFRSVDLNLDNIETEVSSNDDLNNKVNKQFEEQVTAALKQVADSALEQYGIKVSKVKVNMDTNEDGSIYISGVILYLDKQDSSKCLVAKQVMEEKLGVEVKVATLTD